LLGFFQFLEFISSLKISDLSKIADTAGAGWEAG
jgi:hypothetical protein